MGGGGSVVGCFLFLGGGLLGWGGGGVVGGFYVGFFFVSGLFLNRNDSDGDINANEMC